MPVDMPGGDKFLTATGHNGRCPIRFRDFHGVHCGSQYYFFPSHPSSGELHFSVSSPSSSSRKPGSLRAHAADVEKAQIDNRSARYITELGKQTGVKKRSLLFTPGQQGESTYLNPKYIGDLGPNLARHDIMHLVLQTVVPLLWKHFSGKIAMQGDEDEPYCMPSVDARAVNHEIAAAQATVPASQVHALRDLHVRLRSYKLVDWMVFTLSTGVVVLSHRISDTASAMFLALCKACRLLFRPRGLTKEELHTVDGYLKRFCTLLHSHVYRGGWERVPLCR